jgi:hypothetical protein
MRNVAKFVAGLLWDVLGPIGITVISTALLFIAVEAVRWWLGGWIGHCCDSGIEGVHSERLRVMYGQPTSLDVRPTDKRIRLPSATQQWLKSDLLFLKLSLESGMGVAEVAGFLARSENEVREKAEELQRQG